ncbi:MAG: RNA 2',3'-cyclic phosphodiesterase [Proteobacteria bacterium]|nr:MAG: RNA 2',3'-cyclic phosphodiesterase [Pseudomonadota bacterium]
MSGDAAHRLFLALWPDDSLRERLVTLQKRLAPSVGGRAVIAENLHITLKFLGAVPRSRIRELVDACRGLLFDPFSLTMNRIGFFPQPRVVWVGAEPVAESPATLIENIEASLEAVGFARERRRFRAHCTLFRKARMRPDFAFEPFQWPVSSWVLVESELSTGGPKYTIRERFGAV